MTSEETVEILKTCALCKGMTREQIARLLSETNSTARVYDRGEMVFSETDRPTRLFVLLKGRVGISRYSPTGHRILIADIDTPGDMFGEVYLFIGKERYNMHAAALERSCVLPISHTTFVQDADNLTAIERLLSHNLMGIFAAKAYALSSKVTVMGGATIREKVARFLEQRQDAEGRVHGELAREEMADYMGVARPSLSRELGAMQTDGIIALHGRHIEVLDQERLDSYL